MLAGQHAVTRRLRAVVGLVDFAARTLFSMSFMAGVKRLRIGSQAFS
jgi:hypothetical protein